MPRAGILVAATVACALWSPAVSVRTLSAAAVARQSAGVTPLEKVIVLLEGMESKIQADGKAEAVSYDKFACFCKDKTKLVSDSVLSGEDNIVTLSATIKDKTALKATKKTELSDRTNKQASLSSDLTDTNVRCTKEAADYAASDADLSKAIQALVDATKALQDSKNEGVSQANLLAMKQQVQKSLAMAEALKIIDDGPKWGAATALLQEGVDPLNPSYGFHSDPLLNLFGRIEAEFRDKKAEDDAEYTKAKQTCEDTKKDLTGQLSTNKQAMQQLDSDVSGLTSQLATTRADLIQAESTMRDDQLYMKDLTALCEKRAGDWDQRTKLRADELATIAQSLSILKGKATAAEPVNRRALVQVRSRQHGGAATSGPRTGSVGSSLSFLQGSLEGARRSSSSLVKASSHGASAQGSTQHKQHKQQQLLEQAAELLRSEGGHLRSAALVSLAARATADPFLKVKTLIQRLIERLLSEATEEANKKGFCDTELSKALQDRTFRHEETLKLNAQLRGLEAKKQELEMEIGDLESFKGELETALTSATSARKDEKDGNVADIKTANDGLQAITEAIMILKTFYKEAAKATVLAQRASPVDQDSPGAGFEGAYRGRQESSKGIIGLLEVIKSDFDRTVRKTTQAEEEASAAFVEFDRASRADISGKETKIQLDTEDLRSTDSTIQTKMQDMQANMDLVDAALKQVEALKPMCIDTGMSYFERSVERVKEVKALQHAFCILDEDGVEQALCQRWG